MDETVIVPPPPEFKDRRTGLLIFGILLICLGGLAALMVPLMLVSQLVAPRAGGEAMPLRLMLPASLMYAAAAVVFIWLGVGSIMCRRWAWALLLVMAWFWLLSGIVGIIAVAIILPQMMSGPMPGAPAGTPEMPAVARIAAIVIALAFSAVIYILIPGALVFFYRSPHVKATCEACDPAARWTDACPLPVLAISLMLGLGAAMVPLLMVSYRSIVPCFGIYLSGLPGAAVLLVMMVAYAWGARAMYKLNIAGWWIAVIGFALWMVSAAVTFARLGILPMYELMDFPKAQLDVFRQMGFLNSPVLPVLMAVCWLPFIGFVVYTKKFFKR